MSYELLLARRRILMASNRVWPTLLYISEAEVSMCCKDGTDGKGGVFQLHPFFDDGLDHKSQCTWTTSDASRATVNGSGQVSFSSATSYGDVTISCAYRGVTKTCLLTVYETMPSAETEGAGLWLCKGGKGIGQSGEAYTMCSFTAASFPDVEMKSACVINKFIVPSGLYYSSANFASSSKRQVSLIGSSSGRRSKRVRESSGMYNIYGYGSLLSAGNTVFNSISANSTLFYIDGISASFNESSSYGESAFNDLTIRFRNTTIKEFFAAWDQTEKTYSQMLNRTENGLSYVPQNYIKYTDRGSWVNYTVIPNIGTLGSAFDLPSNNVPSAWFGV